MVDVAVPSSKPPCSRDDALAVLKRLRDAGHVAYFAGGCVRDELLGIAPKDYDVATDAPPDRVRELFRNTQAVGAAFGVILVHQGRSVVEVATFRSDGAYLDGRRPSEVHFTNAEEDAKRRDFTINGMFYDPIDNKVIDYVGGQRDLKYKWLRAIGDPDARFEEDHLRLLRAVRFAARFDLEIKGETATAMAHHREQLAGISPERIAEELRLMLTPPTRLKAAQHLSRFAMLKVIFRYLPEQVDKAARMLMIFPALAPGEDVPFGLALAALAFCYRASSREDVIKLFEPKEVRRTVQACRTALKISNEEADLLEGCTNLSQLLRDEPPPSVAILKRFLAKPFSPQARQMLHAVGSSIPVLGPRVEWLKQQFAHLLIGDYAPAPLLTGDDLVAAGWKPGPLFKRVLDQVYDSQLEDRISTQADALSLAEKLRAEIRISPKGER